MSEMDTYSVNETKEEKERRVKLYSEGVQARKGGYPYNAKRGSHWINGWFAGATNKGAVS